MFIYTLEDIAQMAILIVVALFLLYRALGERWATWRAKGRRHGN